MQGTADEPGLGLILLILLAFPVVFVAMWSGVLLLLGVVSGWRGLARRHATAHPPPPGAETVTRAALGLVGYGHTLEVGFLPDALDLRVVPMFRPGHAPLRIPWDQVRHEGEGFSLVGRVVKLRLGEGGPVLRLPEETWRRSGRG